MADKWKVTNQRQTTAIDRSGAFVDVIEVTVEVVGGTVITERIPVAEYTPDSVGQRIEARVADIIAVGDL